MTFLTAIRSKDKYIRADKRFKYIQKSKHRTIMILYIIMLSQQKPFKLLSPRTGRFIGIIDESPKMVDPDHATDFDIRTKDNHENTLCTQQKCLVLDDLYHLSFNTQHSTKFLIVQNEDKTYTFMKHRSCIQEKGVDVVIGDCSTNNDKFIIKYLVEDEGPVQQKQYDPNDTAVIFNYGVEDTDHKRDSVIKMRKDDENYTLVPRNRHHNSHVHRVGGFGDKAYYTYFSYHPSSRHSQNNFHGAHHGIPKKWNDDLPAV